MEDPGNKKRAAESPPSVLRTFKVEDDAFEHSLIKNLYALGGAEEKRTAAKIVDLAGHALGVIVNATHKAVAEERTLKPCHTQVVLDVPGSLLQVKGRKLVADGDALTERFVGREVELVGQLRLTEENKGDERSGIHLLIEQEAKLMRCASPRGGKISEGSR